jgi:propionate catabolism operon transcriptional regulator
LTIQVQHVQVLRFRKKCCRRQTESAGTAMKPKICIVGYDSVINIAKEVASQFSDEAEFIFINCVLEEALPFLREVEGVADIVVAGRSSKRLFSGLLKIPFIPFRPTLPDFIQAIQEARKFDNRIGLVLTLEDRNFNIPLLSDATNVSFLPFFCGSPKEQEHACKVSMEKGCKVIIGGSYAVNAAQKIGLKGILIYKGTDIIRTAIKDALEFYRVQHEGIRRASQLAAVVTHFPGGLVWTDEKGEIILDNPPAHTCLGLNQLQGIRLSNLFESKSADKVLKEGAKVLNVIEKGNLVVNYIPVRSDERIHGLLCSFTRVDEIQNIEFTVRKKLHDRGFSAKYNLHDIVGESVAIRSCKERARVFAGAKGPILLTGESGTGKELFAHAIHNLSDRREGPFVAINCATLPADLLESELFGYEKGAFTGARAVGKKGMIELAHKGTLFLDEITSLGYPLQAKLLRLLAEHEILKLGSNRIVPVEIRIMAATNVDIESYVEDHLFRGDLYYRLSAFRLHIPPLRERPEDLASLFLHFVHRLRTEILVQLLKERETIQKVLTKEPMKGNVRELENIAQRFCLLFRPEKHGEEIETLLESCLERRMSTRERAEVSTDLKTAVEATEKNVLMEMVKRHKTKSDVSRILGVDRGTLWRKLKKYGIEE